jgi:hypothetical protein
MEEETFNNDLNAPHQMALPMKKTWINEVKNVIQYKINQITGKILKERSLKGLRAITQIYNTVLQTEYFPCRWKVGQIMIVKPGKNPKWHNITLSN